MWIFVGIFIFIVNVSHIIILYSYHLFVLMGLVRLIVGIFHFMIFVYLLMATIYLISFNYYLVQTNYLIYVIIILNRKVYKLIYQYD